MMSTLAFHPKECIRGSQTSSQAVLNRTVERFHRPKSHTTIEFSFRWTVCFRLSSWFFYYFWLGNSETTNHKTQADQRLPKTTNESFAQTYEERTTHSISVVWPLLLDQNVTKTTYPDLSECSGIFQNVPKVWYRCWLYTRPYIFP